MAGQTPEYDTDALIDVEGDVDVAVLGGGLAGLSLALQLRQADPDLSVLVAERRGYRPSSAAFKVGESTSEVGAYYFAEVLGLDQHLTDHQIRKNGLRFYLPAGRNDDIADRVEVGTPLHRDIATYQLDRSRLENTLWDLNASKDTTLLRGCRVEDVRLSASGHQLTLEQNGERRQVGARWVVDATGRASILKGKLGLERPVDHTVNAAWLRLAGGFDLEAWSSDPSWLDRMGTRGFRRYATNHLAGRGYWVWLIQLASGPISIGVCADPRYHDFGRIKTLDAFVSWLHEHEPQLAEAVDSRRADVMDYLVIEDFAFGSEQLYSPDRWCLVGEAGVFADPLYSPGSDFIAYGNTYVTDLIVRDRRGEDIDERLEFYDFFVNELFRGMLNLYTDQYQLYGNTQVMIAKIAWDTLLYWSSPCQLFLHGKMTDLDWFVELLPDLTVAELMERTQRFFREWHALERRRWHNSIVRLEAFQPLRDRQEDMLARFSDDALRGRLLDNLHVVSCLTVVYFHKALELLPDHRIDPDVRIQPLAVGLDPAAWETDGLFDEAGISLNEALEHLPGVEALWLEEQATLVEPPPGDGLA